MGRFTRTAAAPFSTGDHDHGACVAEAVESAERICARRGVRLTRLRRRVLELVWSSHAPVGAYDLLRKLSREHDGAAPPTVYRALDFLLEQGLVHRIESRNAFVGCAAPAESHAGQFLICRDCGSAAEMHDKRVNRAINRGAAELGFFAEAKTVEVSGVCPACRAAEGAPSRAR
jgi:Fur family zinc uptake transcriptional regulator